MTVPTPFDRAHGGLHLPSSRYILPQFEERTAYGYKRLDPYTKLFEDRIIFLGVQVDDASADDVMAQLLVLESQDPDRDIILYINSPGGSFTALTAIYDTIQYIKPDIQTVCLGQAASAAAVLLAAGTKGKRLALPNARVLIHQPALAGGDFCISSKINSMVCSSISSKDADAPWSSASLQTRLISRGTPPVPRNSNSMDSR